MLAALAVFDATPPGVPLVEGPLAEGPVTEQGGGTALRCSAAATRHCRTVFGELTG